MHQPQAKAAKRVRGVSGRASESLAVRAEAAALFLVIAWKPGQQEYYIACKRKWIRKSPSCLSLKINTGYSLNPLTYMETHASSAGWSVCDGS